MIAIRVSLAALIMFGVMKLKKIALPTSFSLWRKIAIQGFFSCGLPFVFFAYSVTHVESIVGSVILGIVPMLTALLAHLFIPGEKLTMSKTMGIIFGLCGFLILLLPTALDLDIGADTFGLLGCFLAASCYAIGMVYARKNVTDIPLVVAPTMQLITVSAYLIPLAFIVEEPLKMTMPSMAAWNCVLGLAIFGTALAFLLYFKIIVERGATVLSMVGYMLPLVGTVTGVLFLHEQITPRFFMASLLILLGMRLVNQARTTTELSSLSSAKAN